MQIVLANLCLAHAPLASLIGNRIHWDEIPQGLSGPSVVMHLVSGIPGYTHSGADGLEMSRVQFDCSGTSAAEARAVADALDARLSGFRGTYDGFKFGGAFRQSRRSRSEKDGADGGFTASMDYLIWWAPA